MLNFLKIKEMVKRTLITNSKLKIFICLALSLYVVGCTKEDVLNNEEVVTEDSHITVKNGHLKFQTIASFKNLMTQMQENETPSLDAETYDKFQKKDFNY